MANEAPVAAPEAPVAKASPAAQKLEAAWQQTLSVFQELQMVAKSIKDKESADAAVPQLLALYKKMEAAEENLEISAEGITPEEAMQLSQKYMTPIGDIMGKIEELGELIIEADFYGSQKLKEQFMGNGVEVFECDSEGNRIEETDTED